MALDSCFCQVPSHRWTDRSMWKAWPEFLSAAGEVAPCSSPAENQQLCLLTYSPKHPTHLIMIPKDTKGEAMGTSGGKKGGRNMEGDGGTSGRPPNPGGPHDHFAPPDLSYQQDCKCGRITHISWPRFCNQQCLFTSPIKASENDIYLLSVAGAYLSPLSNSSPSWFRSRCLCPHLLLQPQGNVNFHQTGRLESSTVKLLPKHLQCLVIRSI